MHDLSHCKCLIKSFSIIFKICRGYWDIKHNFFYSPNTHLHKNLLRYKKGEKFSSYKCFWEEMVRNRNIGYEKKDFLHITFAYHLFLRGSRLWQRFQTLPYLFKLDTYFTQYITHVAKVYFPWHGLIFKSSLNFLCTSNCLL